MTKIVSGGGGALNSTYTFYCCMRYVQQVGPVTFADICSGQLWVIKLNLNAYKCTN